MKNAIFSAALLSASILSFGAVAQTTPAVPGSETVIEQNNAQTRDDVAATPGMGTAETADPAGKTLVPGSETQRENNRSTERDAVAAGEDAVKTGAVANGMPAEDNKVIVPGSGADVTAPGGSATQSDKALPDQPSTATSN